MVLLKVKLRYLTWIEILNLRDSCLKNQKYNILKSVGKEMYSIPDWLAYRAISRTFNRNYSLQCVSMQEWKNGLRSMRRPKNKSGLRLIGVLEIKWSKKATGFKTMWWTLSSNSQWWWFYREEIISKNPNPPKLQKQRKLNCLQSLFLV